MGELQVHDVFTPGSYPTNNYVTRSNEAAKKAAKTLKRDIRYGGYFIIVSGPTKVGKTVLVEHTDPDAHVIRGSSIKSVDDLWARFGSKLGIPVSKETGRVTSDKSKWTFWASIGLGGSTAAGEHGLDKSTGETHELHPEDAVPDAIKVARKNGKRVNLVIDDFHFMAPALALEVIRALRGVTEAKGTVTLVTLPHRAKQVPAMVEDIKGRIQHIQVPEWSAAELEEIATQGFRTLNLVDASGFAKDLAMQSYGSPQLMQRLCLAFCDDVNGIEEEQPVHVVLHEPASWDEFYRELEDVGSQTWLRKLHDGPMVRGADRSTYTLHDGRTLDPYPIVLTALQSLLPAKEVSIGILTARIAELLVDPEEAKKMTLGPKLKHMSRIATKRADQDTWDEVQEADPDQFAGADDEKGNTQPAFEYRDETAYILEPFFAYGLRWHYPLAG